MGRQRHTAELIIVKLREAEVQLARGCRWRARQLAISDATYDTWGKEYGGLLLGQAKRYRISRSLAALRCRGTG